MTQGSLLTGRFEEKGSAVFSPDGVYRFRLTRMLSPEAERDEPILFIMLNPSTADANLDDPTIRRCIRFAQRERGTILTVCNIFSLRSTDPKPVLQDPVGSVGYGNDDWILKEARQAGKVIVAWGSMAPAWRVKKVAGLLAGIPLKCLGVTKDGNPRHPLYVKSDAELRPWTGIN